MADAPGITLGGCSGRERQGTVVDRKLLAESLDMDRFAFGVIKAVHEYSDRQHRAAISYLPAVRGGLYGPVFLERFEKWCFVGFVYP